MTLTKLVLSLLFSLTTGRVVNFEDEGGLPDDFANEVAWSNGRLMNETLASLMPGMLQIYQIVLSIEIFEVKVFHYCISLLRDSL